MLKKIFSSKSSSVTGAAILLGATSLVSRLVGLFRDRIFANLFGAGDVLDAYYAAFRIPDFIYNLLIVGAISAGFIPVFIAVWQRDKKEAWRLTSAVLNVLFIAITVLCIILFIFTPYLMPFLTPGFSGEKLKLATTLTRIMLASPIILGVSAIVGGVLQSFKAFINYSLAPILYNLGIIAGAIFFVPRFGPVGLAYGVILGAILHLFTQALALSGHGFKYSPALSLHDKNLQSIGRQIIPRTLSLAVTQVNLLIITSLASTLGSGSITIFNFANNLQYVPVGLIGISFAVAAFPTLADSAAKKDRSEFLKQMEKTIQLILFFILPSTAAMLLLRESIVRVTLGSGAFDWKAIYRTAEVLAIFSISLFAQSLNPLLTRAFFAIQDTWTPFIISVISEAINLTMCLVLRQYFGIIGLAAAFSLASAIQCGLLYIWVGQKIGKLSARRMIKGISKMFLATAAMALAIFGLQIFLTSIFNQESFTSVFLHGFLAGLGGIVVYVLVCFLLKTEEIKQIKKSLSKKALQIKNVSTEISENT